MIEPKDLPSLDEMLQSLLLIEEGEHEFVSEEEDVKELRHLFFPITRNAVYFNHASNGPLPRPVASTMHAYINEVSAYGGITYERWTEYERGAHRRLARMIGVRPDQVAMTASTGDGLMMIAHGLKWQPGDTIVTTEGEFPGNVYPWLNLQEQGVEVQFVPSREHRILVEDVCKRITARTRLVSLGLVQFSTGFRNNIAPIVQYCHERGVLCGIDAMQALGALDIDAAALGVDYVACASHKWLLGPQTIGILYVSDALMEQIIHPRRGWQSVETPFDFFNYEQPLKMGAARFEHSSPNRFPIIALDAALGMFECIDGGMQAVEARILGITAYAIAGLERLGCPVISPR